METFQLDMMIPVKAIAPAFQVESFLNICFVCLMTSFLFSPKVLTLFGDDLCSDLQSESDYLDQIVLFIIEEELDLLQASKSLRLLKISQFKFAV